MEKENPQIHQQSLTPEDQEYITELFMLIDLRMALWIAIILIAIDRVLETLMPIRDTSTFLDATAFFIVVLFLVMSAVWWPYSRVNEIKKFFQEKRIILNDHLLSSKHLILCILESLLMALVMNTAVIFAF